MGAPPEEAVAAEVKIARLERALAREQAKTRALSDISAALGSTLDLDELLTLVASRITEVIDADRSTIYLLDDDGDYLVSRVAEGQGSSEIRLKVGVGLAGWVARTGEKLNIKDAYQDVRFDAEWDRRTGYRTRSTLCVPMKNRHGRTLGVVQVLNKRAGHFTPEDESLLSALATQAAVSIENGKLFISVINKNMELLDFKEQLERRVRELDVLFEIAQVAAGAMELDDLFEGVLARAVRAIEAEAGAILLADPSGDLRFRCAVGGQSDAQWQTVPKGAGISGWVARYGRPQVVNDVAEDDRGAKDIAARVGYHPRSVLAVPLAWEDGSGALELVNKHGGDSPFTEEDVRTASLIANHISTAISLASARDRRGKQERLSTIGQLLSSVLHDLKTPMTIISGYVQILVNEASQEERERLAESVLRQVELINGMTRETIAFARGDRSVWVRKVYLKKFFEELRDQLERELEGRSVTIGLELRDKGVARFDQHKIQRAVHNLARNAAEALGDAGGRFDIVVDRRAEDNALVLTFTDDGPGVPDEIRDALFESFTTHGKTGGTGLGLAIVRKIVDDHDGVIEVESRPGETVFTIVLPQLSGESGVHPAVF